MAPLVLAHRGASAAAPENTLVAFGLARELGADGVELDVRRSRDGALVLAHDAELSGAGVICEHDLVALRDAEPALAVLAEALDECAGLLVNIEIKNWPEDPDFDPDERIVTAVVELLADRGGHDRVLVSSFHLPTVDRLRAIAPGVPTAWLTFDTPVADAVSTVAGHGHDAWHPWYGLILEDAAEAVAAAHARGLQVNTWTVDHEAHLAALAAAGCDALVTNVPDVARRVLG